MVYDCGKIQTAHCVLKEDKRIAHFEALLEHSHEDNRAIGLERRTVASDFSCVLCICLKLFKMKMAKLRVCRKCSVLLMLSELVPQ